MPDKALEWFPLGFKFVVEDESFVDLVYLASWVAYMRLRSCMSYRFTYLSKLLTRCLVAVIGNGSFTPAHACHI